MSVEQVDELGDDKRQRGNHQHERQQFDAPSCAIGGLFVLLQRNDQSAVRFYLDRLDAVSDVSMGDLGELVVRERLPAARILRERALEAF